MTETSEKKLFLLDAYALIFRAYYAFIRNPMVNSAGLNTSAIFGFVNALEEVLSKEKPTHMAIVFDHPEGSFRTRIFPQYKANRDETPEDIRRAVPYIKKLAEAYHIPVLEVPGYEADDVIGTLARQAEKQGFETYMMTPDKDFSQLVTGRIKMYKPSRAGQGAEVWGPEEVKEKFGVSSPSQVIDILALWGDSSDNIPGAPGIGEKQSKQLIGKFGSVSSLFENLDQLTGRQKEILHNFREQVELSYRLATISTDVPVRLEEKKLMIDPPDQEALAALFQELEFRNMAERILGRIREDSQSATSFSTLFDDNALLTGNYNSLSNTSHRYLLVKDEKSLGKLVQELKYLKEFCFDTETTSLDVYEAELVGLSFCWKPHEAFYVPVPAEREKAFRTLSLLRDVFENDSVKKIGQNCKFDIQVLHNYNIRVSGPLFDTMVAHYLLQPEGRHNMNYLAETYLNYHPVSIEDLIGEKGRSQKSMRDVPHEKIRDYACEDADITFRLKEILEKELEKEKMIPLSSEVEMPLIHVLTDMERAGMRIERKVLKEFSIELQKEICRVEKEIFSLAGEEFNISSPKQLGDILFRKLKIADRPVKTKSGQYATGEEILQNLYSQHPVIPRILEYRSLKKLLTTYVDALPRLIHPETGRLHTTFNQTITATGRLSSQNPNLQNIPIREERGREIRRAFVPSGPDYVLLSADYSQIELRLMAHMSRDEAMMEAFRNQADIHTATAARIHKISPEEVTREMRNEAKTANFGIIYGISAFGLSQRLNIDRSHARSIIEGYFESYPGVKRYMDQCIRDAREKGFVTTLLGRKRYLPDIQSRNAVVRGNAERNAINAPIQGSAADLIKMAMVRIHRKMRQSGIKSSMIMQVHDELVFDVWREELDSLRDLVKKEMEEVYPLSVPLVVEIGTGNNWLEAH
ncbi:MAG: DNA polymerase I [Bacteroidales bacterium]